MIRSVSAIDAVGTFAAVLIVGAAWRYYATRHADTPLGRAMAFVY